MANKNKRLTVALAVYNEEKNIRRCLMSVRDLADEMVVVDGGSTDGTVHIAKELGATVIVTDNPKMFHTNKQKALDASHGEWILQLDADEVVGKELRNEIRNILSNPSPDDGYFIPRKNYFLGHWLRKGGQYPDRVIRFFKNGKGSFPQKSVHEQITIAGRVGVLNHALLHYSYESIQQYWEKSGTYIRLTADTLRKGHQLGKFGTWVSFMVAKPLMTFFLLFFRHKGFVDGWYGFLFALFSALHFPKAYMLARSTDGETL